MVCYNLSACGFLIMSRFVSGTAFEVEGQQSLFVRVQYVPSVPNIVGVSISRHCHSLHLLFHYLISGKCRSAMMTVHRQPLHSVTYSQTCLPCRGRRVINGWLEISSLDKAKPTFFRFSGKNICASCSTNV